MVYKVIIGDGKFYYLDPASMKEALLNNRVMEVRDEDDEDSDSRGIISNYNVSGEVDRDVLDLYYRKVLESEASKEIYPNDLMDMIYKLIDSAENKIEDQEIIDLTAMLINMEITHFLIIVYLLKVKQITDLGDLRLLLASGMRTRVEKINKLLDNALESSDASSISISSVRDAIKRDFGKAESLSPPDTDNNRREDTTETKIYKQKMVEYAVTIGTTMFTKIFKASQNLRGFKDLTYNIVSQRLDQLREEGISFDFSFVPLFKDTLGTEADFLMGSNSNYKSSFAGMYQMLKLIGLRFNVNPDEIEEREKYSNYVPLVYDKKKKTMTAYVAGVQKTHSLMSILGYTGSTSDHRNTLLEDAQKNIIRDIVSTNKEFDPDKDIKGLDGVRNIGYITSNLNTLYRLKSNNDRIESFMSLRNDYDKFIDNIDEDFTFTMDGVFSSSIEKYTALVFEGDNYRKEKEWNNIDEIYDSVTKENFFELGIEDYRSTNVKYIKEVKPVFQRKITTMQSIGIGLSVGAGWALGGIAGFFGGVAPLGAWAGASAGAVISTSIVQSKNKEKNEIRLNQFEEAVASGSNIDKFLNDTEYNVTNKENVMMRDKIIEKYLSDIPNPIKGIWSNNLHYIKSNPDFETNVFHKDSIIHSLPFTYSIDLKENIQDPEGEPEGGNIQLSNLSVKDTKDYYYIIDKIMDSSGSLIGNYYSSDDTDEPYFNEYSMKHFGDNLLLQTDSYIRDFLINLRNKVVAYDGEDILYEIVDGKKVDLTTDELKENSRINYIQKIMVAKSLIIDYINYILDKDTGVKKPDNIFSLQLKSNQVNFEKDENGYPLYMNNNEDPTIYDVNYAPFLEVVFITEYIRNYTMKFENIGKEINLDPVFQMVQGLKLTSAKLDMKKFQGLVNLMPKWVEIEREALTFLNNWGGG